MSVIVCGALDDVHWDIISRLQLMPSHAGWPVLDWDGCSEILPETIVSTLFYPDRKTRTGHVLIVSGPLDSTVNNGR